MTKTSIMHHLKNRKEYPFGAGLHYEDEYWCGKFENFIKDDEPLTVKEKAKLERDKHIVWKSCPKCEKAKSKAKGGT